METQQAFVITNEEKKYLQGMTSNATTWTDKMRLAYVCLTQVEAEIMIDRINFEGIFEIHKVFVRQGETVNLRRGIDY
jgi:hypothetical protein